MPTTSWGYRAAIRLGTALTPALRLFDPKFEAGDRGRRGAGDRLLDWARRNRDASRPLAWFHAASVGEGLQAASVIGELRRLRPDCQIIYTHFSPSAIGLARGLEVDAADFLPYDLPGNAARLLASLEPDLLVFAKLDLWPELSTRAAACGCQVAIVAGTVNPGSGRLRWPARSLLEAGYQAVTAAAAISPEDATGLARLGVPRDRIRVLGDPRFDSVVHRVRTVDPADRLLRYGRALPTLVAGSTWPADEAVLLSAFAQLRQSRTDTRLILVPHEPTRAHIRAVEARAAQLGLGAPVRLSQADGPAPFLLVEELGVLATLYGSGSMAYVGGGFGSAGLHSVLEPAAWAIPVVFGPRWRNSRDAGLLLQAGAACALSAGSTKKASQALRLQWESWITEEDSRMAQGRRARDVVEAGLGASERSAQMLARLISSRSPRK